MENQIIRKRYTEQTAILLSKEEREILNRLVFEMKGTNSQIFRLALSKLAKEILGKETNGTTN